MNFRTTYFICIVFAVFLWVYLIIWAFFLDEDAGTNEQPRISEVYGLSVDTVRRIRLSFKDPAYRPLALARDEKGAWQLTDPVATNANEVKVTEILDDILNKRVKRRIEVTELSQYGLDPPTIQIDLWQDSQTSATMIMPKGAIINLPIAVPADSEIPTNSFLIGTKTVNYSVYAKEASESHIFLIESSALQDLTKSPADFRTRNALKFEPDDVTEITLSIAGEEPIRCQTGGEAEWQMSAPIGVKADSKEIRSILDALHVLKVAEFTKDGAADLTDYGLENPRIRLSLQLRDESQALLVGSDIPDTAHVYVKPDTLESVYAVNREIVNTLDKSVFDLRDKRVIDFQRTGTKRFEIRRRGEPKIACAKDLKGAWQIEEPVALKADAEVVDDILFGVDSLKALEFVAEQPTNLSRYGLDAPALQVSFFTLDAEPAVLLLGKAKGGSLYAKARNAERVVLVSADILDLIGLGVSGLRHKQVLEFESEDAFKLALRHGDVQLTCQKQGVNWRLVSPVQEDAKNGAVNSIIYRLADLTADKFLASVPNLDVTRLNKPEVQATITLKNLKEHTLQVGAANENDQHYARLRAAPDTVFLVEASILDELRQTVADLRQESSGL